MDYTFILLLILIALVFYFYFLKPEYENFDITIPTTETVIQAPIDDKNIVTIVPPIASPMTSTPMPIVTVSDTEAPVPQDQSLYFSVEANNEYAFV